MGNMSQHVQYIGGDFEGYYYTHQASPLGASESLPGGNAHAVHIYRGKLENAQELPDYQVSNHLKSDSLLLHNVNQIEATLSGIDRKIFDFDQAVLTDVHVVQSWEIKGKTYGIIKGKLYGKVKEPATQIDPTQKVYGEPIPPTNTAIGRLTGWWDRTRRPIVGGGDIGISSSNSGCWSTLWNILKWLLLLLFLYFLLSRLDGCFDKSNDRKTETIVDTACCNLKDSLIEENKRIRAELDSLRTRGDGLEDSILKEKIQEELDDLSSMIYFLGGTTKVRKFSEGQLDQIVELLNKYPNLQVEVRGYRNYDPSKLNQINIDEDRAEVVKQMLIQRGLNESRIDARGMGLSNVDDYKDLYSFYDAETNTTFQWNKNMRVEVKIVKY